MQTVQFKIDNDYINIVLTILNNLKNDIVKDISIFREDSVNTNNQNSSFDRDDELSKFMAIDNGTKYDYKAQEFLKLGGSGCWSGSLEEMRSNRIDCGTEDSSVLIDFLNKNRYREKITKLIVDEQIATTDVIIMEVLQGIKEDKVYERVKSFMESILIISANIYRTCRKKGKTIRKSIDCLIASISINHGLTLFANDKDFIHLAEYFGLKLLIKNKTKGVTK